MKNIGKILIGSLFALAFVAFSPHAFASVAFNNNAQGPDRPTTRVMNFSQNGNLTNCWVTSIPGSASYSTPCSNNTLEQGQYVSVAIYFHNTSVSETAQNVTLHLSPQMSGTSSTQSFSGSITTSNGTGASAPATVNITSPQTLTYVEGTAVLYRNQAEALQNNPEPLSASQVSSLFSGGFNIGSVAPGWSNQGSLVARFQASTTQVQTCSITSFTANPTAVNSGGASTLSWSTVGCNSVSISGPTNGIASAPNGSIPTIALYNNTTYTLTAFGSGNNDTESLTISINQVLPCTIDSFAANPSSISSGGTSNLSWNTTNCNNVSISGGPINGSATAADGSVQTGALTSTTLYHLTAYGSSGNDVQDVTVFVAQVQPCTIDSFSANPSSIQSGNTSTLIWNTTHCNYVSITGGPINGSASAADGSVQTGALSSTTTYHLTAYGGANGNDSQNVTVTVNQIQQTCTINSFYASPSSVASGSTTTLQWNTTNCNNVSISGGPINGSATAADGSVQTGALYGTTTYQLTAYGTNTVNATATVYISQNQTCSVNSFYANPSSVTSGGYTTLQWSTTSANSVAIYGPSYSNNYLQSNGSVSVGPIYGTATYTLTASCNGTTATATAVVYGAQAQVYACNNSIDDDGDLLVDYPNDPGCSSYNDTDEYNYVAPVSTLVAFTTAATNVTQTQARLNGIVTQTGAIGPISGYFEYGTTIGLGSQTSLQSLGTLLSNNYWNTISTAPNTTYYFRAVGTNAYGVVVKGDILSFTTLAAAVTPQVVYINNTTVSGTGSGSPLLVLKIADDPASIAKLGTNTTDTTSPVPTPIRRGDTIDYVLYYKNVAGRSLYNVILTVVFPKDVIYEEGNGTYSEADHTFSLPIGTLVRDQEGRVYIRAHLGIIAHRGDTIVTTGTGVFTTSQLANAPEENVITYVLNTVDNGSLLAGLALFGGDFLPTTLAGWLVLLLIIALIIVLARRYYTRRVVMPYNRMPYQTNDVPRPPSHA